MDDFQDWDDSAAYDTPEIYPWQRGQHGKFYTTPDSEFVHWQTNQMGEPHHDQVASEWGHQQEAKGEIAPNGAWWFTDSYTPKDLDQVGAEVGDQAADAGLRSMMRGYVANKTSVKSDICGVCNLPYNQCRCEGGATWFQDPAADPVRDLKSPYSASTRPVHSGTPRVPLATEGA
jgi:hypothetical protein